MEIICDFYDSDDNQESESVCFYRENFIQWFNDGCDKLIALRVTTLNFGSIRDYEYYNYFYTDYDINTDETMNITIDHLSTICYFENLKSLDISVVLNTYFPISICSKLKNLISIKCCNNNLTELPSDFAELTNLINVDFSYNKFNNIPNVLMNMNNIISLKLISNMISIIPFDIAGMSGLINFDISKNNIINIDGIVTITNLKILNISHNPLEYLPENIDILNNLEELNIFNTNLSYLPINIGNLSNLTTLNIEKNVNLIQIPSTIGNLLNINKLNLANNSITVIPDEIGNLISVESIYIQGNKITHLPSSIGNLTNLKYIAIGSNYISQVPNTIDINYVYVAGDDNKRVNNM